MASRRHRRNTYTTSGWWGRFTGIAYTIAITIGLVRVIDGRAAVTDIAYAIAITICLV
jgi:hypothetical protein